MSTADTDLTLRAAGPPMDCARFDALLGDYLEGDLDAATRAAADAHRAACARCDALAADLVAIAADAGALPAMQPERDLWAGIAARIEAPVVPLTERAATRGTATRARTVSVSRRWLGAAAAALVVVSAGATYLAVRVAGPAQTTVATAPATPAAAPSTAPSTPTTVAEASPPARDADAAAAPAARTASAARDARLVSGRAATPAPTAPAAAYDREIAGLRTLVQQRREDLDSATVAVLERNLRVIDAAIAESRAALARDPNSRFLGEQLTRALGQKVELMRTAVLLPSRS